MSDSVDVLDAFCLEAFENRLKDCLREEPGVVQRLHQAMHYATMGGGKRLRPQLVYACGQLLDVDDEALHPAACAIELIHCYSLVHDDLPCMDDDDLRRGRPTCHIAFDEATAMLVGDALQTLAFEVLSQPNVKLTERQQIEMVRLLARSGGSLGMAGGQAIDLQAAGSSLTLDELITMHRMKTGALIEASVLLPTLGTECEDWQEEALQTYARTLGLAFQVQDDILDVEADTETLGKSQGSDARLNKPTFTEILGLGPAKDYARDLIVQAQAAILPFGQRGALLKQLAEYVIKRGK